MSQPLAYQKLVQAFDALPGVGGRAAARYAQYVLSSEAGLVLQQAITAARTGLVLCDRCFCLKDRGDECLQCAAAADSKTLYVVPTLDDADTLNEAGYSVFVLHGLLSPVGGVGPSQLKLKPLQQRLQNDAELSLVLVFPVGVEADATEHFIHAMLMHTDNRITRVTLESLLMNAAGDTDG